ncbi:hypothetical protein [Pseudomonas fluorescens]|jgi:hypothetical protein|uniref:hypothetical protein n=1 Tax=Pseudomonas fluorescens TaxID=294 RepID=UPI0020C9CF15|nr:hypothetical protein [Pseudomonas fluorescens]
MEKTLVDNNGNNAEGLTSTVPVGISATPTLAPLKVVGVLPDGLVPLELSFKDIPVVIDTPWMFLAGENETDWLYIVWHVRGSQPVDIGPIALSGPLTEASFPYDKASIPKDYFQNNAVVDIFYRVHPLELDNPSFEYSPVSTIIIDRAAPGAGQDLAAATFVNNPITEFDLSNNQTLDIIIPGDYLDRKTGDTVLGYLNDTEATVSRPPNHRQSFVAVSGPMTIQMPVAEIRKFSAFSELHFIYRLQDKVGNLSSYSFSAKTQLRLNALPANLSPPEVPAYESDLLINREDARGIVSVRVRQYDNLLPGDQCVVEWDGIRLPATTVNRLPHSVVVDWSVLIAKGANLRRIINLPVRYFILRAGDTVGPGVRSPLKLVTVDMTIAGQENPQAPALLNRQLALVNIQGAVSATPNRLDSRDANKPVRASFALFDNPLVGERALLYWPGQAAPVATYLVKAGDVGGRVVDFDNLIPWSVVQAGGSNATTLVNYQTDNGVNQQLSPDQTVFVSLAPPINYPRPSFPQSLQHPNRILNCNTKPPIWQVVEVLIDPSPQVLQPNDVIVLSLQGFRNYPDRNPIPSTADTFEFKWGTGPDGKPNTVYRFQITAAEYETLIRPLSDFAGGSARYSVFQNKILIGTSAIAYVQIDRKFSTGNYCGPNGIGPGER